VSLAKRATPNEGPMYLVARTSKVSGAEVCKIIHLDAPPGAGVCSDWKTAGAMKRSMRFR
jgi:hypothetical protein